MKCICLLLLIFPLIANSQLQVAKIFSNNMVLQRNEPIRIWGKASPGKTVSVSFAQQRRNVLVQRDSSWSVSFNKQKANVHPQTIFISCDNEKTELQDVLIGDVWICSGQSNMEWPMSREKHWKEEKMNVYQPLVRFNNPPPAGRGVFGVAYNDSLNKRLNADDFYRWTSWQSCDSNSIKDMSAVAYYFAKAIVEKENIPIGLINLSIGGAPIETFISREALQKSKEFSKKIQGNWLDNKHLPVWIKERGRQNVGGTPNGFGDASGLNHAYKPGFAFEAGIKPLLSFPVKGIIWYQGESNAQEIERVEEYASLSALMVEDYRRQWRQFKMPFYYVQLSSIDTIRYKGQLWPQFRDEQRKMLQLIRNSGMAVTSDIGAQHDVHPTNKKDVGERLARWALRKTYHHNIVPSGPLPLKAKYKNGKVIMSFQLMAEGLKTSDGKKLKGFSLDSIHDAEAVIDNSGVLINADTKPAFIYYGWKPFSNGNLVNSENLPASTFKIEVE